VPNVPEDYVHRIGRTARAEATGDAISLFSADEAVFIRGIERLTGIAIPRQVVPGFDGVPERLGPEPRPAGHRPSRRPGPAPVARHGGSSGAPGWRNKGMQRFRRRRTGR